MDTGTDVADYFKSELAKKRRDDVIHARVPVSLKKRIENLAYYWTEKARISDPEAREISEADVLIRLMDVGLEGAWTDMEMPSDPSRSEIDAKLRELRDEKTN